VRESVMTVLPEEAHTAVQTTNERPSTDLQKWVRITSNRHSDRATAGVTLASARSTRSATDRRDEYARRSDETVAQARFGSSYPTTSCTVAALAVRATAHHSMCACRRITECYPPCAKGTMLRSASSLVGSMMLLLGAINIGGCAGDLPHPFRLETAATLRWFLTPLSES
jgi:hypothetical protein